MSYSKGPFATDGVVGTTKSTRASRISYARAQKGRINFIDWHILHQKMPCGVGSVCFSQHEVTLDILRLVSQHNENVAWFIIDVRSTAMVSPIGILGRSS